MLMVHLFVVSLDVLDQQSLNFDSAMMYIYDAQLILDDNHIVSLF